MSEDTKTKILDAVIDILGQEGIQNVTIRKIAEITGVNVASLNYHFGTKEKLIHEAMFHFKGKMAELFSILHKEEGTPTEKLEKFMKAYSYHIAHSPGVFKSIFIQIINQQGIVEEFVELLQKGTTQLRNIISQCTSITDKEILDIKVIRLMSSLVYPALFGKYMKEVFNMDYKNDSTRTLYLDVVKNDTLFEGDYYG